MAVSDFEQAIEQYHTATGEFVSGNPEPQMQMFSHRDDVSLLNPLVPVSHGWEQVARTLENAASQLRDGEVQSVENIVKYATDELGFIVEVERARVKVGGREDFAPIALRVTTIFRVEEGAWRIVHRHADPLTSVRSAESITQG